MLETSLASKMLTGSLQFKSGALANYLACCGQYGPASCILHPAPCEEQSKTLLRLPSLPPACSIPAMFFKHCKWTQHPNHLQKQQIASILQKRNAQCRIAKTAFINHGYTAPYSSNVVSHCEDRERTTATHFPSTLLASSGTEPKHSGSSVGMLLSRALNSSQT